MTMRTGDGAYIKQLNRGLILQEIIKNGKISRADLSKRTGLNKATISVQVADLLEEDLIYESREEHNTIGRRPIMLGINNSCGYILGIDIDTPKIQFAVADLSGIIVEDWSMPNETTDYSTIVEQLIGQIIACQQRYVESTYGLISVNIGVHGTVNVDHTIDFIPKLGWKDKDLKGDLAAQLNVEVTVGNNANFSAYAENVYHHQSDSLLNMSLTSGVGIGVIIEEKLHTGFSGHAGEVGHMILYPEGKECPCGNRGCLELYASEPAFLTHLAANLNKPDLTMTEVKQFIKNQDETTLTLLDIFLDNVTIGLNNIIHLHNPKIIVLNSELLSFCPETISKIENRLHSTFINYHEIVLSSLGGQAAVMGGCAIGLQHFFNISKLDLYRPPMKQI